MEYNFSKFFKDNNNLLLDEFIDKYTYNLTLDDNSCSMLNHHYQNIIELFSSPFKLEEILNNFENLAKYEIVLENPYVITINEIYSLKTILINQIVPIDTNSSVFELLALFEKINDKIAQIYLDEYIKKLLSINNVRINSLSDILDRNMIKHYEAHLIWLSSLAKCIKNLNIDTYPELDGRKCDFGKWLHNEAKDIVQNNSKLKSIHSLHDSLHLFGRKILKHINNSEYHILMTYLEKCELLSLSIGTELSLIENILMNKKITKDALTGAMNRHGLESVFESQYELSLATNNSFVIAMCDLDFFKKLNDSYGHLAGDKMLKLFVNTVKTYIRNSDVIIRYGGEEFILLLPAINKAKGYEVLEKIRKAFEKESLVIYEKEVKTTVSIGLLEIKPEYYYKKNFLNEYINIVDQKLYMAKENGRNRVEVCC